MKRWRSSASFDPLKNYWQNMVFHGTEVEEEQRGFVVGTDGGWVDVWKEEMEIKKTGSRFQAFFFCVCVSVCVWWLIRGEVNAIFFCFC